MQLRHKGIRYAETYRGTGRFTGRFLSEREEKHLETIPAHLRETVKYVGDMTQAEFEKEFLIGEHRIDAHREPVEGCPKCEEEMEGTGCKC